MTHHDNDNEPRQARLEALESHGVKYAGSFQRAQGYRKGTVVTSEGAMWIALRNTQEGEQPGKAIDAWQLAEKTRKHAKTRRQPA